MRDGRTLERDYIPIFEDGQPRGHLWLYRDISGRVRDERRLHTVHTVVQLSAVPRPNEPVDAVLERLATLAPARSQAPGDRVHLKDLGVEPEPPQVDAGAQPG